MYIHIHVRGLLDCLVSTYKESPLFPPPFLFKVHSGGTLHIVCTRATDIYTVLHKVVVRLCILRQLIGIPKGDGKVDSICLAFYNWIWGRVRSSTILITHESDFIMPNELWWEWKISERERRSLDYFLHLLILDFQKFCIFYFYWQCFLKASHVPNKVRHVWTRKKKVKIKENITLSDRARNSSPNECTVWYPLNADKRESNFIMDVISKSPTGNQNWLFYVKEGLWTWLRISYATICEKGFFL